MSAKIILRNWMLLLSLMTALITMISIFSIVSTYLEQRKNSYRILRVCGMKKSRIRRMMIMEIILFLLIGYIIGVLSGLIAHKIIMVIQYRYFGLEYLPGYSAEKIIQFHTYSPYLFALLFALLSFAAVAIKEMRAGKQKKKAGKKRVANPLNRVLNFYDQRRIKIVSVVLVLVSLSFGYAYLAASIEHDEGEYSDLFQLADSSMTDIRDSGFDYIIYRNKETDNKSGVNINVDTGVEQEVVDTLSRRDDVEDVQAVITDLTTELLIDRTVETEELRESIQDADYEHQTQGSAEEWGYDFDENWYQYYERYYEEFGLEEDVSHYSMPVVACTDDMLDLLEQYLVSGTIDREGILNGSAVLIVKNGESYLTNPFEVGDTMNLMDRVIKEESDIGQESEDESYVPQTPIYASPVVCGVLEITDDNLNDLLEAYDAPSYDVNIAANVLTTRSGYLSWGFPQSNYNKVCVKATEDADSAALDKAVNELITSKQGVTYVSLYTQLKKMQQKITSNVVSYVFTLILLLLIFLIGYGNILSMQYVASRKRNALLNGMGYSNRQTRRNFELSNLKYLGIASLISLVAILGIQGFLKLVVQFQVFILGYENMEYSDRMKIYDKLDEVFMLGYRIHSQNVIPVMIMLVAVVCLISWIVMRLLFSGRSETVYHEVEENAF
jgi:ABC-type lipoprotein release transport system permease subunit